MCLINEHVGSIVCFIKGHVGSIWCVFNLGTRWRYGVFN